MKTNFKQNFRTFPEVDFNFNIGSYQLTQNWLKDRKDRVLYFEDIMHYQKIIKALVETDRVMKKIGGASFMKGGEG